jgi:hypothetical protein
MYKIGFIIKGYAGKSQYYSANVKPFVDLSIGLKSIGYEVSLFIDESERHLEGKIRSIIRDEVNIVYFHPSNILRVVSKYSIEYVVVEDEISMMKTAIKLREQGIKIAVFVQYLYGINTNKQTKRAGSIELTIGSYLPWRLLTKKYRDLIVRFDYIISNSKTCGYILRQFYDLSPSGTVYPPVGIDMRPILDDISKKGEKRGILIFTGNIVNDYFSRNIKEELKNLLTELKEPVKLFVSNPETATYFSQKGVKLYSNLSVGELVKLYTESSVTYVPTEYELFGHVGAESLLCGTPVILDVYHPFLESFPMETNAVKIAHPNRSISEVFIDILGEEVDIVSAKKFIYSRYSAKESAKLLAKAIEL